MKQPNECGSVRNDEMISFIWDLTWALESASPASCKRLVTSIDSVCPSYKQYAFLFGFNKLTYFWKEMSFFELVFINGFH